MSDELRDAVRSAIAEMVAESPEPPDYQRIAAPGDRPAVRWSGPVWALAMFVVVLVVVGAAAWLRRAAAPNPPVTSLPSISDDVGAAALPSVFVTATHIPDGLSLVRVERGPWDTFTLLTFSGRTGANATEGELLVAVSTPQVSDFRPDIGVIAGRLAAAYPDASVTETTVRGQPAFLIDGLEVDGWTTAVVAIEESGLISEVQGRFIDPDQVLAVARGLGPVSRDEFEQTAVDVTDWDLQVDAHPADPTRFLSLLADVPGVESAVVSTSLHLSGHRVAWTVQRDSSQAIPTTTEPAATVPGSVTTVPVVGAPIRVMVTIKAGVDPETVAAAIHDLGDYAQVSYSPAIGAAISTEYLETVLSSAAIVHQDPIIYQPAPGPEPTFDTSKLGTEVTLEAATTATVFSDATLRSIDDLGRQLFMGASPVPLEGPIINVGSIDDGKRLVLAFVNDHDYLETTIVSNGSGSAGGRLGGVYGYGNTAGGGGKDGWYINVRVPLETSVVSVAFDDGTALWQRPIAGYGLFPVTSDISRLSGTITALAADGTVIGQWDAGW